MPSDEGGVTVPFARSDAINQSVWGFKDLAPLFSLRWQQAIAYVTGNIPIGSYSTARPGSEPLLPSSAD